MALLLLAGHHGPRGVPEKDRKGKKLVIPRRVSSRNNGLDIRVSHRRKVMHKPVCIGRRVEQSVRVSLAKRGIAKRFDQLLWTFTSVKVKDVEEARAPLDDESCSALLGLSFLFSCSSNNSRSKEKNETRRVNSLEDSWNRPRDAIVEVIRDAFNFERKEVESKLRLNSKADKIYFFSRANRNTEGRKEIPGKHSRPRFF